jgi:uncharacterized protein YigE (DUF2233 family)
MSRRKLPLILLALAVASGAIVVTLRLTRPRGLQSKVVDIKPIEAIGDFRRITFSDGRGVNFDVVAVRFDRSAVRGEFVDLPKWREDGLTLEQLVNARHVLAAINGGYFDAAMQPRGLRVLDGATHSPASSSAPLSGFVVADNAGRIDLLDRAPEDMTHLSAIQCGPFLIDPGGNIGIHRATAAAPVAGRSVVALGGDSVILIVSSDVTLFDLAASLHDCPMAFGVQFIDRAINLDGGPSTGMAVIADGIRYVREPAGVIRDAMAIRVQRDDGGEQKTNH